MTSDAVRELEEKNEALRARIVTAHAERDSALALVHARTVNLDAMRTDRDAAVKRAEEAEQRLAWEQAAPCRVCDCTDRNEGREAFDTALAKAREEMRDAAVMACHDAEVIRKTDYYENDDGQATLDAVQRAIASLPTTGGGR